MLNSKLLTTIFTIMATVCFTACDDKDDNTSEVNACDPATCEIVENATEMACDDAGQCVVKSCIESFKTSEDAKSCVADEQVCECDPACKDTESCVKGEADKCECKPLTVEECKCEDGTVCPEGDKTKCVTASVEDKCAGKSEGYECDVNKTCQKVEDDKLECKDNKTPEEPTEPVKPE